MLTFKNLKNLVDLPAHKEARVPTVKALEESGVSVVAEKILENHGSISVYQNGYVIYRAHNSANPARGEVMNLHGSQSIWSAIRSQLQWQSLTLDNR